MIKTKLSDLTNNKKRLVKNVLGSWEYSEFAELRDFGDELIFVFRIQDDENLLDFIDVFYDSLDDIYKRKSDRNKVSMRIT